MSLINQLIVNFFHWQSTENLKAVAAVSHPNAYTQHPVKTMKIIQINLTHSCDLNFLFKEATSGRFIFIIGTVSMSRRERALLV